MHNLKVLHEHTFAGKPLQSFKVYNDPFGEGELCIDLSFTDGQVASLCIGPGRPKIVSSELCFESSSVQQETSSRCPVKQECPREGTLEPI